MTAKKCTKKRVARAKLLFCQSEPIDFLPFSLTSPSSLLELNYSLSFEANFSFFSLAKSPPRDLQKNCLQVMVCSCAMPSNCVWLQIILCTCVKETVLLSFLRSPLRENGRALRFPRIFIKKNKLGDQMIKQLLNSVVAKYRDLSVSRRSIICRSRRLRQIIDLLATDKSRYFAQPRPIIVNYVQ